MPVYFAAPTFARQGVVAGFVLSAPDYSGVPEAVTGPISCTFYVTNIGSGPSLIKIATGYQHWVEIGGSVYSYTQQAGDSASTVAAGLANAINGAADPYAVATAAGGTLTLAPRTNTGAMILCRASDGNSQQQLTQLVGNELVPACTKGVLFAQAQMYRPAAAPTIPAAPASRQSWLWYSSTGGFYWTAAKTPTTSDDALIGWVVTNASMIVAISSRRIGTGAEAAIVPGGPVAVSIGLSGAEGDTDVPPAPIFGITTDIPGELELTKITFASLTNTNSLDAATYELLYIDLTSTPLTLTAAMGTGDTSISASGALPYSAPGSVQFTFHNTTAGGVTIGPGYAHNIVIGSTRYSYVQQTEDSASDVAAAIAAVINEAVDAYATAAASGATVTLVPVQNTGASIVCSASDGNSPATLVEAQPVYVVIDGEVIRVNGASGSAVVRGQKASTAIAHANGAQVWPLHVMTRVYALPQMASATAGWPSVMGEVPFANKGLVAADLWVTNALGNSPTTTNWYGNQTGGYLAPTGTSGGSSTVNPAPNLTSIAPLTGQSTIISYGLYGNQSSYRVGITLGLPTTNADYLAGRLRKIHIIFAPTGALQPTELKVLYAPWAGTTLQWQSDWIADPATTESGTLFAYPENDDGALTQGNDPSGQAVASASLTIAPSGVSSEVGGDASTLSTSDPTYKARWTDNNGSQFVRIYFKPVLAGNLMPQMVSLYLQYDRGNGLGLQWYLMGTWPMTTVGQVFTVDVYAPTASAQSWNTAVQAGYVSITADPVTLPAAAQPGAAFTVAAVAAPGANSATGAQFVNAPGTSSIYRYQTNPSGTPCWDWYALKITLTPDNTVWYYQLYVQPGITTGSTFAPFGARKPVSDSNHGVTNPYVAANTYKLGEIVTNGTDPSQYYQSAQANNAGHALTDTSWWTAMPAGILIWFASPVPDWTYDQSDSGQTANTWRMTVDAVSRLGASPTSPGAATTLTCWSGGAAYSDLTPTASTGLDMSKANSSSLDNSLTVTGGKLTVKKGSGLSTASGSLAIAYGAALADDGSGNATVKVTGPIYKDVSGNLNFSTSGDFVVSGGTLTQNAVNLAKAYGFNTTNFTTSGGNLAINQIAVNSLIAGNALFLGTTVFAASGGGQVTLSSSGLTLANTPTSPTSTMTLTSSGCTVATGSNSVQITGTGVGIYGPSGSVTATSGGIAITNGSSSVTVTPSAVSIVNGSLTSPTINGGSLTITTSNGTVSISNSTAGVYVSSGSSSASLYPNFLNVSSGSSYSALTGTQLTVSGLSVVNSSGQFVGPSASCSGNIASSSTVSGYTVTASYGGFSTTAGLVASGTVSGYSLSAGAGGIGCSGALSVNGTVRIDSSGNMTPNVLRISASVLTSNANNYGSSYTVHTFGVQDQYGNYLGQVPIY